MMVWNGHPQWNTTVRSTLKVNCNLVLEELPSLSQRRLMERQNTEKAVYNKFASPKFMAVSKMECLISSFVTNLASQELQ